MKKIFTVLMALGIALCTMANPTFSVAERLDLSKVKTPKMEKQFTPVEKSAQAVRVDKQEARQAMVEARQAKAVAPMAVKGVRQIEAMPVAEKQALPVVNNKQRAAAQVTEATDTVEIVATTWVWKYYESDNDWYTTLIDATETYEFKLDYVSDTQAGTFTEADCIMDYTGLYIYDAEGNRSIVTFTEVDIVVTDDENGLTLHAELLGTDNVLYVVDAHIAPLPEPKATVELAYPNAELLDATLSSSAFQFSGFENGYYTSIFIYSDEVVGEYETIDMYDPYYNYIAHIEGTDTTFIDFLDLNAVVTKEGKTYNLVADVLGSDTILYHITMSYTKPDPTDTIDIVATNLYIDEFEFWGMVFTTATASNDEYEVTFDLSIALEEGEYVTEDFNASYCGIVRTSDMAEIAMTEISATVTGEGGDRVIKAEVVGSDNVLYNMDLSYVVPEATDTVQVVFDELATAEYYSSSADYYIVNQNENYIVTLDIFEEKGNLMGEYSAEDFDLYYTQLGVINGDTTIVTIADAKAVVTPVEEGIVLLEAELTGMDAVLYKVSTKVDVADKGLQYDATEGFLMDEYTTEDIYTINDQSANGYIMLDVESADGNDLMGLVFWVDGADENTIIPTGTYQINDTQESGSVLASTGMGSTGLTYSLYATLDEEGYIVEPCWFMVGGEVVVSEENGILSITVDAVNSNNLPIFITCEYDLNTKQGLQYDMTEGGVERTYGEADIVEINADYVADYGELYMNITAADGSDMVSLAFFVEATDDEIIIPAGVYTIDDSGDYGTVYASPGVIDGSIYPSFYGVMHPQGGISVPCYFMVGGQVVVENVDGQLKMTIDALNSYDVPAHIVYEVVVEEPEKTEPTYTENNLNPYAFGLESVLAEDALVVTYRLNNSNATSVNVVVYNGDEVVATVPGTTTIGVNTVEVATADLPAGVELTWAVEVNGTSVEVPTREEKIYSFYHPSGVDIDNNPENATFGLLLVNEGMQSVASKTEGYVSAGFGAGIFAFTPSFDLIPNGELPGYNGGIEFTTTRADGTGTAYAPRRVRISEDGRIFVTSLNTDGNYLWEVNPDNLNEWTSVFSGTLNENKELVDAEGNFVAAPNNGFDVKGSGENLQLAMYSVNLSGITAAAMSGFRLHEYNLGTATEWATAPSKALVEGKYAINYTGTQVEYDNEGGFWIASYRGSATDANPGLVHINAEGVEDLKLVWNNVRQAGIRFNNDFTKLVVAGNNGAAKKATIYAVSKDENGAPVLTEETVIDMAVVGNNLNDFAWDYAGNLYSCGNSSEKLAAWAMPYSGQVVTPAAAQYKFELAGSSEEEVVYEAFEMSNLSVTPMGAFELLEASDDMMGLSVVLGYVLADGSLMEGSAVDFNGQDLPILEGTITKSYSEDLATDVYVARLIVEFMGGKLGLEITMYAGATAEPVEVVISDATAEVIEATGTLQFTATWSDGVETYPVRVTVAGYEDAEFKEYEGAQISELQIGGDGDNDPWLDFAVADAVAVFKDGNLVSLEGEYTSWATGTTYYVLIDGTLLGGEPVEPVEMVGVVKRALQYYDATIVLTHEEDGTAHIYSIYDGVATEMSQNGIIARDAENAGDLLAISDIALTEDGKLVAVNSMVCQAAEDYVDAGYKRGETRFYIWEDFESDPKVWFKSSMYGNWFRSKEGESMALKGDSENAQIMVTSIHASKYWSRFSVYSVIDGVYNEPADAATGNEHYTWCEGPANGDLDENVVGAPYELLAAPTVGNWIVDGTLIDPIEFVQPEAIKEVIADYAAVTVSNGKVFKGSSIVAVAGKQLLVSPYANEEGLLLGVQVLDITAGLANAEYVDLVTPFDAPIAVKAVATAVSVVENGLDVALVVDNTLYPVHVGLELGSNYEMYEDVITNLVIDYDNLLLIGGPSEAFQVEVVLGLGDYDRNTDAYQLLPASTISVLGSEAQFIDGYASVDGIEQSATAVVHCTWNGMALEFHLTMTAAPLQATVVVVENATIEIEKYLLWGDMYDYSLKMTGVWTNEGVDYPVLVEVPVYYPEATEPYEIYSTVTVGGWGDDDPWLGFGEGYLTITPEGQKITATGIVENPMAGIAIDITISGSTLTDGFENATVTVKAVKSIKNGQLIIVKDGKEFNAQGAIVK